MNPSSAEPDYASQIAAFAAQLLAELLAQLKVLGDKPDAASLRAQASLALQLFELIAAATTLDAPALALASKLFGLAAKSPHVDRAHQRNAYAWVARRAKAQGEGPVCELHARLHDILKGK
jgi:hypothetical protein